MTLKLIYFGIATFAFLRPSSVVVVEIETNFVCIILSD